MVAFFGGPIAQVLYSALNSYRLRRPADAVLYLSALVLTGGFFYWLLGGIQGPLLPWIETQLGTSTTARYLPRILALLLWGGFYLLHRQYHRSADLMNVDRPRPWIPALACIALGYGGTMALVGFLLESIKA